MSAAPTPAVHPQTFAQQAHLPTSIGQWVRNAWNDTGNVAQSMIQLPVVAAHTAGDIGTSLGYGVRSAYRRASGDQAGAARDMAAANTRDDRTRETIKSLMPFRQQIEDLGTMAADKFYNVHYDPNRADGMQDGIGNDTQAAGAHFVDLVVNHPATFAANTAAVFGMARSVGIAPEAVVGRVRAASAEASLNADRLTTRASRSAARASEAEAAGDEASAQAARQRAAKQTAQAKAQTARSLKLKQTADTADRTLHTALAPSRAVTGAAGRALDPVVKAGAKAVIAAAVPFPKAAGAVQGMARGVADRAGDFQQAMQTPISLQPLTSVADRAFHRVPQPAAPALRARIKPSLSVPTGQTLRQTVPASVSDPASHRLAMSILGNTQDQARAGLLPTPNDPAAPGGPGTPGSPPPGAGRNPSGRRTLAIRRPSSRLLPPPTMRIHEMGGKNLDPTRGSFVDLHSNTFTSFASKLMNNGVDTFNPWATNMVQEFGPGVLPHLTTMFDETKKVAGQEHPLQPTIYAWQKNMDANGNVGYSLSGGKLIPAKPRVWDKQPGANRMADLEDLKKQGATLIPLHYDRTRVGWYIPRDLKSDIKIHLNGGAHYGASKTRTGRVIAASDQARIKHLNDMANDIPNLHVAYTLGAPEMSLGNLEFTKVYDAELRHSITKGEVDPQELDIFVRKFAKKYIKTNRGSINSWQEYFDLANRDDDPLTYTERNNFLKNLGKIKVAKTGASVPYHEVLNGFNDHHSVPQNHIVAIAKVKAGQGKALTAGEVSEPNEVHVRVHPSYGFVSAGGWKGVTHPIHADVIFGPTWKKSLPNYTANYYHHYGLYQQEKGQTNMNQAVLDIIRKHEEGRGFYDPAADLALQKARYRGNGNIKPRSKAKRRS